MQNLGSMLPFHRNIFRISGHWRIFILLANISVYWSIGKAIRVCYYCKRCRVSWLILGVIFDSEHWTQNMFTFSFLFLGISLYTMYLGEEYIYMCVCYFICITYVNSENNVYQPLQFSLLDVIISRKNLREWKLISFSDFSPLKRL